MDICYKFATFQVSLFIHYLWSFRSRLTVSVDLQHLNICLGLVEEILSITSIAAFKSSGCTCHGDFILLLWFEQGLLD